MEATEAITVQRPFPAIPVERPFDICTYYIQNNGPLGRRTAQGSTGVYHGIPPRCTYGVNHLIWDETSFMQIFVTPVHCYTNRFVFWFRAEPLPLDHEFPAKPVLVLLIYDWLLTMVSEASQHILLNNFFLLRGGAVILYQKVLVRDARCILLITLFPLHIVLAYWEIGLCP